MEPGSILHDRYRLVDTLVDEAPTTIYRGETTADGYPVVVQTLDVFAEATDEVFRELSDTLLDHLNRGKRALEQSPETPLETPLCCGRTDDHRIYLVYAIDPDSASDLTDGLGRCLYQLLEASAPLPEELEQMIGPVWTQTALPNRDSTDASTREVKLDNIDLGDDPSGDASTTPEIDIETLDAGDQVPSVEVAPDADTSPRATTVDQGDQLPSVDPEPDETPAPHGEGNGRAATVDTTDGVRGIEKPADDPETAGRAKTVDASNSLSTVEPEPAGEASPSPGGRPEGTTKNDQNRTKTVDVGDGLDSVGPGNLAGARTEGGTDDGLTAEELPSVSDPDEDDAGDATTATANALPSVSDPDEDDAGDATTATANELPSVSDPGEDDTGSATTVTANEIPSVSGDGESAATRKPTTPMGGVDPEEAEGNDDPTKPTATVEPEQPADSDVSTIPIEGTVDTSGDDPEADAADSASGRERAPSVELGPKFADDTDASENDAEPDAPSTPSTSDDSNSESGRSVAIAVGAVVVLLVAGAGAAVWFFVLG